MAFRIRTEVKVGVIALITIGAFIWGYYFLKGKDLFKSEDIYYAVYPNVNGLAESSPVIINGMKVGLVRDVRFVNDTNRSIFVTFSLPMGHKVPLMTVAEIYSLDLMGSKGIRLILYDTNAYHSPGDTLLMGLEQDLKEQVSAQVLPLKLKAEELLKSIDSVMIVIQYILNENARDNLAKTFTSIKKTIQNLEHASIALDTLMQNEKSKLSRIFSNIESISANLRNNNDQLSKAISNFADISDSLAQSDLKNTIYNANKALTDANVILDKIKRGEGTMGMLLNNDSLYNNLERASLNLDKLLQDMRENPKRYLHFSIFDFGKTVIVDENGDKVKKSGKQDKNNEGADNTIWYKIQIRSARTPIRNIKQELKGIDEYEEHEVNGWYKYTIGNFTSLDNCADYYKSVREQFPGSFVVAYQGGMQVPVTSAPQ